MMGDKYPSMEKIGKRLKRLREAKNLSQQFVATEIGVPPSTYRDWEYGKQIVGEPYSALADVLGVSVHELVTGQRICASEIMSSIDLFDTLIKKFRKDVLAVLSQR